jgi:hypothetical protein
MVSMTTITDYASLVTAVTEYLAREEDTTLIARIPTFLQLTEAKLNRELYVRQMENRATTTIDITTTEPEFISLPDDFQSMRRVRLSSVAGKPHLLFKSGVQMDEYRTSGANVSARPYYFTILGTEMELAPTPDQDYEIEMVYRATIPPLTVTNTLNWLLTLAPDLYLYGALLESAPYIKEDARIQTWGAGFATALDGLNKLGMTSTFNSGPLQMRVSGRVF